MSKCTDMRLELRRPGRSAIEANFEGSDVGSGGAVLPRRANERIGLNRAPPLPSSPTRAIRHTHDAALPTC